MNVDAGEEAAEPAAPAPAEAPAATGGGGKLISRMNTSTLRFVNSCMSEQVDSAEEENTELMH